MKRLLLASSGIPPNGASSSPHHSRARPTARLWSLGPSRCQPGHPPPRGRQLAAAVPRMWDTRQLRAPTSAPRGTA